MTLWISLVAAMGFLLAEDKTRDSNSFTGTKRLVETLVELGHILWQSTLLVAVASYAMRLSQFALGDSELLALVYLPLAALLSFWMKKKEIFLVVVLAVTGYVLFSLGGESLIHQVKVIVLLVLGIAGFEIALLGLREKMLLAAIPKALEELPIRLLVGALVSLVFLLLVA